MKDWYNVSAVYVKIFRMVQKTLSKKTSLKYSLGGSKKSHRTHIVNFFKGRKKHKQFNVPCFGKEWLISLYFCDIKTFFANIIKVETTFKEFKIYPHTASLYLHLIFFHVKDLNRYLERSRFRPDTSIRLFITFIKDQKDFAPRHFALQENFLRTQQWILKQKVFLRVFFISAKTLLFSK